MDTDVMVAAITGQLDSLQSLVRAGAGVALISAWAGIQNEQELVMFSAKVKRRYAFYILSLVFIIINICATLYFLRIGDLLLTINRSSGLEKALVALATHKWALNPFAYFGESSFSQIHSNIGYGVLIVVWWIANSALLAVRDDVSGGHYFIAALSFLAVGLVSMLSIQYVYVIIFQHIRFDFEYGKNFAAAVPYKTAFTFIGISIGAGIYLLTRKLQAAHGEGKGNVVSPGIKASLRASVEVEHDVNKKTGW